MHRVDLTQPYVASFGTAHPGSSFYQSEPACKVMAVEAEYRHPAYVAGTRLVQAQGEAAAGNGRVLQPRYHRAFDVYSLGCVLLGVFTWTTLRSMGRGWEEAPQVWREDLVRVARRNVPFMAGSVVMEIVARCLDVGVDLDGEGNGDLEGFCWDVLERLDKVRV